VRTQFYTDFDEFRATNAHLDGEWLLNGGSEWGWRTDAVDAGNCQILRCYSNTGLIIEGKATNDAYGFYVPFKSGVWRNNGTEFHDDEILIFEPGAEHGVTSKVDDGWHLFHVPKHLVGTPSRDPQTNSYTVRDPRARAVRAQIGSVLAAVEANPAIESSTAMKTVEAELLSLVLPLVDSGPDGHEDDHDVRGRSGPSTVEIVHRAQAILEDSDAEPMTASLLANLAGVSERRLRQAFNERYQVGPRRYLLLRQLHAVRRDLLASQPEATTVTEAVTARGVWHFGRFTARYKSLFNELPSETLRRGPRIRVGVTS
jgi:AraC family ethanolamine operon transcriptional activator